MRLRNCQRRCQKQQGFTLIELLVAIFVMSILAVLSWQGIDGMVRSQAASRERTDYIATMQTALAQWQTDLDQIVETRQVSAVDFDGRVLRITRRYSDGATRVVGWARRNVDGQVRWLRWQSSALQTRADLQAAWLQVQRWGQNPGDAERAAEVTVAHIDEWQIFYFRNNAWTNPLSADGASNAAAVVTVPDGIRLVLRLSPGQPLAGELTRDWARPIVGGAS